MLRVLDALYPKKDPLRKGAQGQQQQDKTYVIQGSLTIIKNQVD